MSNRPSLTDVQRRVRNVVKPTAAPSTPIAPTRRAEGMVMTGLHLPAELLNVLRRVAVKRAERGGRVSVSAVIADLVRKHRAELEDEL